jgi:hypothetical protein
MAWITPLFVEPFYRLIYGRPSQPDIGAIGESEPRSLILTVGGVGGENLCGTGLRYVIGAERPLGTWIRTLVCGFERCRQP